jgi:hypothetical protein
MKKIIFSFLALLLIAGSGSCQEKIDIEKEKEAIKAVIENHVNSAFAKDFAQLSKSLQQDESLIMLGAGKDSYQYGVGWEEISSFHKERMENNPSPSTDKLQFTNYKIKVYKESAWAVYNLIVHNSEGEFLFENIAIRFLEKVNGEWKIVYMSWILTTSYEDEEDDDED